jgi:putative RNA 2'-phosphotransferase
MMKKSESKSKYLSYLLRHKPESAGLTLSREGWCSVEQLIAKTDISLEELIEIVQTDSKGRYSFEFDQFNKPIRVRANQGHSTEGVRLKFKTAVPPAKLYHGTAQTALHEIEKSGLLPMSRHHVHLSADVETAESVCGRRKSGYSVLEIDAKQMLADGHQFYISANGVWLADSVPPKYLKELK